MALLLSRESDYAVVCMLAAAESGHVSVSEIAHRYDLSASFLGNIVASLARARLVVTRRGAGGGFSLARSPSDITVLEVVETIQGPLALQPTIDVRRRVAPSSRRRCYSAVPVFGQAEEALRASLDISLADVLAGKISEASRSSPRASGASRRSP